MAAFCRFQPCPTCCGTCSHCNDGSGPATLQVVLSGMTGSGVCTSWNGTYYLDRFGFVGNSCAWRYVFNGSLPPAVALWVEDYGTYLLVRLDLSALWVEWQLDGLSDPHDCQWASQIVPYARSLFAPCSAVGSTATVSAV